MNTDTDLAADNHLRKAPAIAKPTTAQFCGGVVGWSSVACRWEGCTGWCIMQKSGKYLPGSENN